MAEPYRFGGPIPVSAGRLKYRRELRASRMYADLKRIRRERAEEERAAQYKHDAKTGVVRAHLLSSDEPINFDLQKEQAKIALAPFKRHDAPADPGPLPLSAWRIEGQDFSRPGFTTDFEQAKFWTRRGATVTTLHQPSEEGLFRTVSGAVLEKLTPPQSRAALAPCCTHCGNARVVLAALMSEGANRWRCECGATGLASLEWRSEEAPPLASSQTSEPLPGSDSHFGEFPR